MRFQFQVICNATDKIPGSWNPILVCGRLVARKAQLPRRLGYSAPDQRQVFFPVILAPAPGCCCDGPRILRQPSWLAKTATRGKRGRRTITEHDA